MRRRTELVSASVTPLHRLKKYEELDGAQGREVFFRPHRYRAADLSPLRAEVVVGSVICQLLDVSQNGVGVEWPAREPLAVGALLHGISVKFDGFEAYHGEARVSSLRDVDGTCVAGLSFEGPLLQMDDVLDLRVVAEFAHRQDAEPAWRAAGVDRFKLLVCELRLMLEDWSERLAQLEGRLPWHVLHGEGPSAARSALIEELRTTFVAEVVRQTEEIDAAVRSAPKSQRGSLKVFSRRQVHEFLMQSPCLHRMQQKPFGYPGDYEMMRFIYERHFEGSTLFARAVNLAFISTKPALAVRCRKDLVKNRLSQIIDAHAHRERPLRILSVAAGPAQELVELLGAKRPQCPVELVLFDQDKSALAYAFRRIQPVLGTEVRILYLHDSIKRLLRDSQLFAGFGTFDAIYSAGLFDYLQASTASVLMRNLYQRLAPGGALMVGNMTPDNPGRWIMEDHLEWELIYRTRQEMLEVAERAVPGAPARTLDEESGVNPFVELTRD